MHGLFESFLNIHPREYVFSILTYGMMVVCVAILLRSRRPPANTIAWIAVIALSPYVGMPLFIVLGGRKMTTRRERSKAPIYSRVPYVRTQPTLRRMERVLLAAGAPAPVRNRSLEVIETGERAYEVLVERIRAARHSIDLEVFILKRDASGIALLRELTVKAAEGLRVRVLLDAAGSHFFVTPSLRAFRRAGGKVAFFMPLIHVPFRGRINLRNHRKFAVFDGEWAWFGGMNLAMEYLGAKPHRKRWADLSFLAQGRLTARQFSDIFRADWEFAGRGIPPDSAPPISSAPPESVSDLVSDTGLTQLVASGPDAPEDPLYEALLEGCFEADRRIWIATPYFVPDESLIKALELACRRGVDVRILIPKRSDHWAPDLSRGSYVRQLLAVKGRVFRYPKMMHAKLVVVDDAFALAGSANFDLRSLLYNYETGIFLHSRKEVDATAAWMERAFAASREGYPPPGFWRDLAEGVGRIFGPLL